MDASGSLRDLLVPETATMRQALELINSSGRGIAFVVDDQGRLKGVVTDGNVRRALLRGVALDTGVGEVMTKDPVRVKVGTPLEAIMERMSEAIKYIPVTDDAGKVMDYVAFAGAMRLPVAAPSFSGNELRYVTECVLTSWISSRGRFVSEFEQLFAKFVGVKHAIAVTNGTAALHLGLVLANVGPGDEVIVPTLTFIATANAVRYTGATPVFVDSEPRTWNMDPEDVARKVTARTRTIIPVHLYGHPADMDPILDLAGQRGLWVIEDAAEAHGALYKGQRVGGLGRIGCFSFFGNKIVTTGEGGMLVTDDDEIAERARMLQAHGMSPNRKYWHDAVGFNYRLTNLQAAIGVAQMEQIDTFLDRRARLGALYASLLNSARLELPVQAPWAQRVNWLYTVLVRDGLDRDRLIAALQENGVESRPVFYPIHLMPPYAAGQRFPVAESIARRGISLPSSASLSDSEIEKVCAVLKRCLEAIR